MPDVNLAVSVKQNQSWSLAVNGATVARGIAGTHQDQDLIAQELEASAVCRTMARAIKYFLGHEWAEIKDHTIKGRDARDVAARGLIDGLNNVTTTYDSYAPGVPPAPGRVTEGGKVYITGWQFGDMLRRCLEATPADSDPKWARDEVATNG